jgi:hypothetical protein
MLMTENASTVRVESTATLISVFKDLLTLDFASPRRTILDILGVRVIIGIAGWS